MTIILWLLSLLQTPSIPGPGPIVTASGTAPPFIKSCNGNNFGGTSQTCIFGSNVASTSVIYVTAWQSVHGTLSVSGCGATWTIQTTTGLTSNSQLQAWGRPASGACTITYTSTVSGSQSVHAVEYGPSTGGVDNMVNLAAQTSITGGSNISCPAITTAATNERVICSMTDDNAGASTYTAGSGFTIRAQGTNFGWMFEDAAESTAGTYTPQATYVNTTTHVVGSIALKP